MVYEKAAQGEKFTRAGHRLVRYGCFSIASVASITPIALLWLTLLAPAVRSQDASADTLPSLSVTPVAPLTQPLEVPTGENTASSAASTSSYADSSYVLGAGDRLSLVFFNVPEYNGQTQIAIDGSLNLPLVGRVPLAGLTLETATQTLEAAYRPYLRTPLVTLNLILPRPIQIGISGEVNQPGAYKISLTTPELDTALKWPTVVEAIQLAGGITDKANVRQVEVTRLLPTGKPQLIVLNLWEVVQTGEIRDDITLRHGDAIRIPTASDLSPEELTQLSAANFSPSSIRVTVVGEVEAPGTLEIPPNAPLNQALLAAGSFDPRRADVTAVELVRLNPNGTVSQRTIPIAFDQGLNEDTNPSLRNNDVVIVSRSGRAVFADNVGGLLDPIGTILSPFRLLIDLFR